MDHRYLPFGDAPGLVNSQGKLRALNLPPLVGKSFLDVGCNEGFYCKVASDAGACPVVGLDNFPFAVERARARFPNVTFVLRSWENLPEEKFDVILFASGLHYLKDASDIEAMLSRLRNCLTSDGLLILEAGVADSSEDKLVEVIRPDGTVRYPSSALLADLLDRAGLTWRYVARSEPGDNIDRLVYHCRARKGLVLFVRGEPNSGKSYLAEGVASFDGSRIVRIDDVAKAFFASKFRETLGSTITNAIRELISRDPESHGALAEHIAEEIETCRTSLTVAGLGNAAVVVDGLDATDAAHGVVFEKLLARLAPRHVCWDSRPLTLPQSNFWEVQGEYVDCGGYLLPQINGVDQGNLQSAIVQGPLVLLNYTLSMPKGLAPKNLLVYSSRGGLVEKVALGPTTAASKVTPISVSSLLGVPIDELTESQIMSELSTVTVRVAVELDNYSAFFLPEIQLINWPFKAAAHVVQ